jgi:nitroreductase
MNDDQRVGDHIALLRGLRAIRDFLPTPVPQAVVDDILDVAHRTGSAFHPQPWELVVVRDRERLRALAAATTYARHLEGSAIGIVIVMAGEAHRVEHETYDEGRLSERIMLAAAAHGLGSCVGWVRAPTEEGVKAILGIPAERRVRTLISIGYPDEEAHRARPRPDRPPRRPFSEIVHQERFGRF